MAQETYAYLLGCIEAVDLQSTVLLNLIQQSREARHQKQHEEKPNAQNEASQDRGSAPSLDPPDLESEITEVIGAAAELANLRFSKVIGVRTELHANLNLNQFLEIFDTSWRFVVRCEIMSRRMIVALRGVLVGQAKAFLQSFHQVKITESAKLVEQEQWTQTDVPRRIQETVNRIIRSAVEDPETFMIVAEREEKEEEVQKQLEIEGSLLHAVGAVLETLKTLGTYLEVVVKCSLLTTDTMGKVVEFLKAFNSRTCQVVLGAGAMRSAGLKNITAKHLGNHSPPFSHS